MATTQEFRTAVAIIGMMADKVEALETENASMKQTLIVAIMERIRHKQYPHLGFHLWANKQTGDELCYWVIVADDKSFDDLIANLWREDKAEG